ncbi:dihydroneopterin aldolase family protein [Halalkalicoccus subterraneus]|uniref:dihydroneopterin aldolase family protein n=1 Tax=Halalkalicoccus subterraneus TaxID=2675002 RepID=UPI000EFB7E4F|nr:dihydroneopterin aldolase family protein [Halalkalicoccus subterraneus]
MPTDSEIACFEAGIKFGTLYHQFTGTPVDHESAPGLERAIEEAIENQPHCVEASVTIHEDRLDEAIDPAIGYTELQGPLMDAEIRVEYEGHGVLTKMELEDGYPRMYVASVEG